MRDQFRYTLKIGKNRELKRLWAVSAIFFCFQFPMIAENWVFLRVTEIDITRSLFIYIPTHIIISCLVNISQEQAGVSATL